MFDMCLALKLRVSIAQMSSLPVPFAGALQGSRSKRYPYKSLKRKLQLIRRMEPTPGRGHGGLCTR